jgi:hypothetical protein
VISDIEQEGIEYFHWYIDPFTITLPHIMEMSDVLSLNVKIDIALDKYLGYLVADTLDIQTENGLHQVIIKVDSDLISGITNPLAQSSSVIESISPNPFSHETRISFNLDYASDVSLAVYNLQGQVIRNLATRNFSSGSHQVTWDGKNNSGSEVSAGIYLLKLETDRWVDFRKLIISY